MTGLRGRMGHWRGTWGKQHPAACHLTGAAVRATLLPPQWHIPKISAVGAWRFTTGSPEVKVRTCRNKCGSRASTCAAACCRQEACRFGCMGDMLRMRSHQAPMLPPTPALICCCCYLPPCFACAGVPRGQRRAHRPSRPVSQCAQGLELCACRAGEQQLPTEGRQGAVSPKQQLPCTLPGGVDGWLPRYDADAMLPPQSKLTPPPLLTTPNRWRVPSRPGPALPTTLTTTTRTATAPTQPASSAR